MWSFAILLSLAVSVFFLLVVPWLAIAGRRDARQALAGMDVLRDRVMHLAREVEALRGGGVAPAWEAPRAAPARLTDAAVAEQPTPPAHERPETEEIHQAPEYPWGPPRDEVVDAPAVAMPPPPAPPRKKDLEEVIGARWAIWVGGLALALGSLFLVRYTVEAGFFGPAARLVLAALFSSALIGVGEMLRRGAFLPRALTGGPLPVEHAPLALTGAGTVGLFGTVYAAHALYAFIPQGAAFVLLGLIGMGAMAASLLHGQALAGLGLVASYATPILIGGESRNRWPLVIFLLVITAAGLALHARVRSAWLGWAVVAGVAGWTTLLIMGQTPFPAAELAFMIVALGLFAGAFLLAPKPRYPMTSGGDPLPVTALAGLLAAIGLSFVAHAGGPALHAAAGLLALGLAVAAVLTDGRAGVAIVAAGLLPLGVILTWPSEAGRLPVYARVVAGAMLVVADPPRSPAVLGGFAALAAAILALPAALLFQGRLAPRAPHGDAAMRTIAIVAGLAAPTLVFAWAIRSGGLAQNLPAAALLAVLGGGLALLTQRFIAAASDVSRVAAGGYGAGAALAFGLAIALALPGLWMAVGFAAAAAGSAWLNGRQPLPMLRRVTAAFATTAVLRGLTSPVLQSEGAWPVFNSYIAAYGAPALLLAGAGWLLAREARDRPLKTTLVDAGLMAAIYAAYTIRHAFHRDSLIDDYALGLGESGLYVLACLAGALGLTAAAIRSAGPASWRRPVTLLTGLGAALSALLPLTFANPWIDGTVTGPRLLDSTFMGFALPGLALGVLAYVGRTRPELLAARLTAIVRALAILMGYLYAMAQTRIAFVGQERFSRAYMSEPENYAYSAVTLLFGVLLLAIGFRLGSRPTRLASAAFVLLAVLKVFLFDLSELEGLLRALSFIGLGAVLIGIGLAYQRLLFDKRPKQPEEKPLPAPA